MILDTTVLVDLQREIKKGQSGPATTLLKESADELVYIAFVTWMEFAEGFDDSRRADCERFLSPFPVLWPDLDASWQASRLARHLAREGQPIGDHDAWIAALALRNQIPVLTRNDRHFRRVSGLKVRSY